MKKKLFSKALVPGDKVTMASANAVNPPGKGAVAALSALQNGQKFFLAGVVGDFVLDGWAVADGAVDQVVQVPIVRQINQRRTPTKAEVLGPRTKRPEWCGEIKVTILEDFALQQVSAGVQKEGSSNSTDEDTDMASKKKAAKKTSSKAPAGEKRGRAGKYAPEAKIKVLVAENPKREKSASYKRFELYTKHNTVAAFLKAGGTTGDLHYDVAHKLISIS